MAPLLFMLVYLLGAVNGAAAPEPTPAAVLDKRQQYVGAATIWSPTVVGTSVSYGNFGFGGSATIITSGAYWNWCSVGFTNCLAATACSGGTVFYPGTTFACSSTENACGTEYLFSTTGANAPLTRPACYPTTGSLSNTYFLVSPVVAAVTTPTTSTTTGTTPNPTHSTSPTPAAHSTPIGAIVGGVVGGIAIIAIIAIVGLLVLRRRSHTNQPTTAPGQPGYIPQQQTPQLPPMQQAGALTSSPYDNKHASYAGSYQYPAGSPNPGAYPNPGDQNPGFYAPQQHGAAVPYVPHNGSPGPIQPYQQPPQQQYAHPQNGVNTAGPVEMPGYEGPPRPQQGAVEMHADQPQPHS